MHRYHDNDDLDYKGIKQVENLFNEIDEDYYKPIKTKGSFNNNYIEYESRGDKDKRLSVKEYLYTIIPYFKKLINNHKATITDSNDLSGVWKIQLTMRFNFVSSLDPEKIRVMNSKSDNIEIMIGIETGDVLKELFESFLKRYQKKIDLTMMKTIKDRFQ